MHVRVPDSAGLLIMMKRVKIKAILPSAAASVSALQTSSTHRQCRATQELNIRDKMIRYNKMIVLFLSMPDFTLLMSCSHIPPLFMQAIHLACCLCSGIPYL